MTAPIHTPLPKKTLDDSCAQTAMNWPNSKPNPAPPIIHNALFLTPCRDSAKHKTDVSSPRGTVASQVKASRTNPPRSEPNSLQSNAASCQSTLQKVYTAPPAAGASTAAINICERKRSICGSWPDDLRSANLTSSISLKTLFEYGVDEYESAISRDFDTIA